MKTTVGVVGVGIVGSCQVRLFETPNTEVRQNDPAIEDSASLCRLVAESCAIFVCVPTPAEPTNGAADTRILDSVISEIAEQCQELVRQPVVAVRSTVPPDILTGYQRKYPGMRLLMNPEFLIERAAFRTSSFPDMLVIGGDPHDDVNELAALYATHSSVRPGRVILCDLITASLLKYAINSFLALKVTWANQFCDLLAASGARTCWDRFVDWLESDPRLGRGHFSVPGPDGQRGYGGKCLPKDLTALLSYAGTAEADLSVLQAVREANHVLRSGE